MVEKVSVFTKYDRNYDEFSAEGILVEIFNCGDFGTLLDKSWRETKTWKVL